MKDDAQREGHVYLDYFSALADEKGFLKAGLADDGLHPNAKGCAVIGPLAEQAIAAALKARRQAASATSPWVPSASALRTSSGSG